MKMKLVNRILCAAASAVMALASEAGEYVADPYRAVGLEWPRHDVKGKNFWLLLKPAWRNQPGVAEEPFVQESGLSIDMDFDPPLHRFLRTVSIRDVKAFDAAGAEVPVTARLTCAEKGSVAWTADDGSLVVSGDHLDPVGRYRAVAGDFSVRAERPFSRLTFRHGTRGGSAVEVIEGVDTPAVVEIGAGFANILPKEPVASLSCALKSAPWRIRMTGLRDEWKLADAMRARPFFVDLRISPSFFCLPEGSVDFSGLLRVEKKYPETYVGIMSHEWDSNYLQKLTHGPTGDALALIRAESKIPCSRLEMADNMYIDWRNMTRTAGRNNIFGMSGGVDFMQYGADFGARTVEYEITECVGGQTRIQNMVNFSAARQFGISSSLYMAYFAEQYTADSNYSIDAAKKAMGTRGTDWGTSPNYSLRCFYLGYYMGNNFLRFESQTAGQTIRTGENRWALTGNGRAIKDIWEWSEKKEGARGEWYAPVLLLRDRASVSDGKYPLWKRPFAFYDLFPATDGDAYADMVNQLISPFENRRGFNDPSGGADLVNSEFADIFTSYISNPLMHGEVAYEDIAKYPVAFVLGDMNWSQSLCNTMKQYVAGGGTLVLTDAQAAPFDDAFTGWKPAKGTVDSKDGLVIRRGKPLDRRDVVRSTSDGLPLVIRHAYRKGRVLLVTSPNFRGTAKKPECYRPPKELKELLLAVQREVVPFSVKGDCETVYSRMPDGSWKVLLVNNTGLAKKTNETEEHYFPEYAREVTLELPPGATAAEVRTGAAVRGSGADTTVTLPPAGILVVDVKGVDLPAVVHAGPPPSVDPVRNFVRRSEPTGVKNDGFRYDPEARWPKEKAPPVVGEWLSRNGFRDSSGNGRDLKVVGPVEFRDGVAVMAGDKPTFARIDHAKFLPTLYEGTIETWVKPDVNARPIRGDKRGATFGVCTVSGLMLASQAGRWALSYIGSFSRQDVLGPEVKPEWTHLCIAFKDGVYDLYVNGVKVKGVDGPLRGARQGKDSFYDTLTVWYGSLEPAWGFFFRGEMKGLRYLSRRLSSDEIARISRSERMNLSFPNQETDSQ